MPRQNRVNPCGELIATPARGTLMGNRGCLHNEQEEIIRPFDGQRWIYCRLELKPGQKKRHPMPRNEYTALFFLDEATALAAGHRPCAQCLNPRFKEFINAWIAANPDLVNDSKLSVDKLDSALRQERLEGKQKKTFLEEIDLLPSGCFIIFEQEQQPYLVQADKLLAWQAEGYTQRIARPTHQRVRVLTPPSIVRALARGFQPIIHPSAQTLES